MPIGNPKASEIKRLTTPLTFKDSRAYDDNGNIINCIETINDVRYVLEPKEGILSDEDILKYAPKSKAASEVRLRKGLGNSGDVLLIHESLPWIMGLYYVTLICISVPVIVAANRFAMLVLLILFIIPLVYLYRIFNLNSYVEGKTKKSIPKPSSAEKVVKSPVQETVQDYSVSSLKRYEKEISELKVLFDVKEEVVRDLIGKRFAPPQLTYDKFISIIDSSHKLFYKQVDSATNIINLAAEDTPRVRNEIQAKIDAMHTIIDQIEKLTNELVINISNESDSDEDVKNLLDDMENLIGSVKEY
jgi:hypothetical protein